MGKLFPIDYSIFSNGLVQPPTGQAFIHPRWGSRRRTTPRSEARGEFTRGGGRRFQVGDPSWELRFFLSVGGVGGCFACVYVVFFKDHMNGLNLNVNFINTNSYYKGINMRCIIYGYDNLRFIHIYICVEI